MMMKKEYCQNLNIHAIRGDSTKRNLLDTSGTIYKQRQQLISYLTIFCANNIFNQQELLNLVAVEIKKLRMYLIIGQIVTKNILVLIPYHPVSQSGLMVQLKRAKPSLIGMI